ncbi:hypothetical protein TNCT_504131 [Trichonephila clavata]|uniref:Uncharacterized protein n=1 Tax=Trichonephila clavata TaxID=2740835 RepID=A0A8X6JG57_TRICU|nr:hypothetical protein TNCT_504131 [Trichonephila clavata]
MDGREDGVTSWGSIVCLLHHPFLLTSAQETEEGCSRASSCIDRTRTWIDLRFPGRTSLGKGFMKLGLGFTFRISISVVPNFSLDEILDRKADWGVFIPSLIQKYVQLNAF